MKKQVFNPYLPSWEYTPDGEPHVFGDRLYVFGSHDRFGGSNYCLNDYVCWSCPTEDLSNWRFEGVIYRKDQAPGNKKLRSMQAPDVAQGPDGRYYLYYTLMFSTETQVAVCDTPAGRYEYYGTVHWPNGKAFGKAAKDPTSFDPAIFVNDDGRIWFYAGTSMGDPTLRKIGKFTHNIKMMSLGGVVLELEPDMLTIRSRTARPTVPGEDNSAGTEFEGHEFFEASSMRRFGDRYYFIYSSVHSHDLSYATADAPDGPFHYGGILLSNGNIGISGPDASFYWGNNHGSLVQIGKTYYVFGHRQTNANEFSRQAIAQEIACEDGMFRQAEMTSGGLGGLLPDRGTFDAGIASLLIGPEGACKVSEIRNKTLCPYLTQSGTDREENPDQYLSNILFGTEIGYTYFDIRKPARLALWTKGWGHGRFEVRTERDGDLIGRIEVDAGRDWTCFEGDFELPVGIHGLYLRYYGQGSTNLRRFSLKD